LIVFPGLNIDNSNKDHINQDPNFLSCWGGKPGKFMSKDEVTGVFTVDSPEIKMEFVKAGYMIAGGLQ
jgi:hypothetical protein